MARVVALVPDVFFQARIMETARHLGVEVKAVPAAGQLPSALANAPAALVIVDLNAPGALEAIEQLRAGGAPPVVGFLSHVQAELAERARAAGCAEVLPRSAFTRDLAAILSRAGASAGSEPEER